MALALRRGSGLAQRLRGPLRSGAFAPAQAVLARSTPLWQADRDSSSPARQVASSNSVALSKMGTLAVDRMAGNSAVQGAEYVLTGLDRLVNWARKSSVWPMTFGLA